MKKSDCACDICSGRKTPEELSELEERCLIHPGWYIHYVPYSDSINAHTHGVSEFCDAEIQIVLPLDQRMVMHLVNALCEQIKTKEIIPAEGMMFRIKGALMDCRFNLIDNHWRVILPDAKGLFPEDESCSDIYNNQMKRFDNLH